MKVLTIPSCKQCPYCQFNRELETYECAKFGFELGSRPSDIGWPADCKLNDLPEISKLIKYADDTIPTGHDYNKGRNKGFKQGANFVIQHIKK